MIFDRRPIIRLLADKRLVKEYICWRLGGEDEWVERMRREGGLVRGFTRLKWTMLAAGIGSSDYEKEVYDAFLRRSNCDAVAPTLGWIDDADNLELLLEDIRKRHP